jgi:hypothetical protein
VLRNGIRIVYADGADAKSAYFAFFVNDYSEKSGKFDRLRINRLAPDSEWSRYPAPKEIHTRLRMDYTVYRDSPHTQ